MNPLLEVFNFDSDADQPMVLCVIPGDDGVVRFAIPATYMDLMRLLDGERTVDEAIDALLELKSDALPKERLQRLVRESLIPKGILVYAHQDPRRVAVSKQPKLAFLYIKLPIIKSYIVNPIARRLGFLYRREPLILGALLFIATHFYVYAYLIHEYDVNFNQMDAIGILTLMLLSTIGTFFHEFGHASAAAYYGCRRMTIGWGLYLIYTVLWTNVSEAWKLPRRQRAIIDIGGVYFESFFLFLMLFLFLYTKNPIFLFAFIFIDLAIATTFNPFLRMDGYWLMSDLFGIVNLRDQQVTWLHSLVARLVGAPDSIAAMQSRLSRRAKICLATYSVLGAVFFIYILVVIYEVVVLKVLIDYPDFFLGFWRDLKGGMSIIDFARTLLEIGWRTLMIFGAGFMLFRFAKSLTRNAGNLKAIWTAAMQQRGMATGNDNAQPAPRRL